MTTNRTEATTTYAQKGQTMTDSRIIADAYTCPTTKVGLAASDDGIIYLLTPCCGASAKGSGEGVVCRSCYRPIPSVFGAAVAAGEDASHMFATALAAVGGCPVPADCAWLAATSLGI